MAQLVFQFQCLDQSVERQILMGKSRQNPVAHLIEIVADGKLWLWVYPHGEHVDEETDDAFKTGPGPIGDWAADAKVALAQMPRQHYPKCGKENGVQCCPMPLGDRLETLDTDVMELKNAAF